MSGGGLLSKLKNLDAYPKINEDFFTKTMSGGIITIASTVVMLLLFLSELRLYLRTNTLHELTVDTSRGETITIEVDVTFPRMPCAWLSLDTMDISGELHLDVDHDVYKQRLGSDNRPIKEAEKHDVTATKKETPPGPVGNATCGTCYGAEDTPTQCCNTCDEVRAAYRKKGWALGTVDHIEQCKHDSYLVAIHEQKGEGCKMWGKIEVNKVAGNFHFAPGRSYQQGSMHVHDIAPFGDTPMDFSHTINRLTFGKAYPGMKNPLDGLKVKQVVGAQGSSGMYQYFLKVVPTVYSYVDNRTIHTNQYSVTENFREAQGGAGRTLPGVFFFYDLSPIKVTVKETQSSFLHFLTSVCAIVGGVFTVSGIVDAFVYQSERLIRKKLELGKLS
mmetsp:Transcript_40623/g.90320  ORF Transcript_40623/g.90320 Transcript_40623/m.90320 type:complete len:388 (-) Transcript_40623:87-1250(-)|eukprot:CAMPEP_0202902454 /NCGR_PEP_ID=MMETSP1392-20130828/16858_1 /ASSEMBLY_ACC=CAM_ASM_000868 /TAXON_ID=225041 /ORGANISM="Chlamydomonas chlamydogama, Strain SAG 11-48b" /LENGTH=387 /DNA_ID=CAMNT_0049589215 /DNA_START=198 /DNA_END=1361 /DNA_ORIENTATION=+